MSEQPSKTTREFFRDVVVKPEPGTGLGDVDPAFVKTMGWDLIDKEFPIPTISDETFRRLQALINHNRIS